MAVWLSTTASSTPSRVLAKGVGAIDADQERSRRLKNKNRLDVDRPDARSGTCAAHFYHYPPCPLPSWGGGGAAKGTRAICALCDADFLFRPRPQSGGGQDRAQHRQTQRLANLVIVVGRMRNPPGLASGFTPGLATCPARRAT